MFRSIEILRNGMFEHTKVYKHQEIRRQIPVDTLVKSLADLHSSIVGNVADQKRLSLQSNTTFLGFSEEVRSAIHSVIDFKAFLKNLRKTATIDLGEVERMCQVLAVLDSKVNEEIIARRVRD